jgi:hypothetical protein
MSRVRNVYENAIGKDEDKRPLERHRHRWEDSMKRILKEKGYDIVD